MRKVVLPTIKNPPVVESLVTKNPASVNAEEAIALSSLFTTASISFKAFPPIKLKISTQNMLTVFIQERHIRNFVPIIVHIPQQCPIILDKF